MTDTAPAPPSRILVVDDEPDLRTLYELTLLREGYLVDTAASVAQARARLRAGHYELLITDMRMPDGSGIDVLADVPITFSEWNIANPSIGGFVTTANSGTLEVLLHLTQGPGNPASKSSGSAGSVGGGGPVTVPSTTVPPLSVPSS